MSRSLLIQKLKQLEETLLLELLDIKSEDIVDAFLDKIEERIDYLYGQLSEEENTEE